MHLYQNISKAKHKRKILLHSREVMEKTRGFITIATGNESYYKMAANLLKSYRFYSDNNLPFAILSDKENEYTKLFDKTIILKKSDKTYLDKIELLNNIPFDETIFIEADCLIYGNLNNLFNDFNNVNGFSAMGRSLPIDTKEYCWFKLEETGKYKNQIRYMQRFHSGIMWFNDKTVCEKAYEICKDVYENYEQYNIGGNREAMDDKLFAVSSAIMGSPMSSDTTIDGKMKMLIYPIMVAQRAKLKVDFYKNRLQMNNIKGERKDCLICHWASFNTKKPLYKREVKVMELLGKNKKFMAKLCRKFYFINYPIYYAKYVVFKVFRKIKRILSK